MSIAVAVCRNGKVAIGADAQIDLGDQRLPQANHGPSKLHQVGTAWVAITGWEFNENVLADYLARRAQDLVRRACEAAIAFDDCGGSIEVRTLTSAARKTGARRR